MKMLRVLLITMAAAAALPVLSYWTPVQARPAVAALVDNPWKPATKQTLSLAIVAAEKFDSGRVLEIRFRIHDGVPGFDAVLAKDDAFSHLRIAIPSNLVTVIAEAEIPAWMASWVLKADAKSLEKAKLPLVDAVLQAEQIADAPAVDAGIAKPLTGLNQVLAYNIEVIKYDRPERVVIDAVTGLKIADPDDLLDGWTPEKALYESLKKVAPPRSPSRFSLARDWWWKPRTLRREFPIFRFDLAVSGAEECPNGAVFLDQSPAGF